MIYICGYWSVTNDQVERHTASTETLAQEWRYKLNTRGCPIVAITYRKDMS